MRRARPLRSDLIASAPYRYVKDRGPLGYFQPSNIVKKGDWYYAMFRNEPGNGGHRFSQPLRGACVMRTQNLTRPEGVAGLRRRR